MCASLKKKEKHADLCVQQASYLEGGPLLWILSLYLYVNKKSEDDDSGRSYLSLELPV